MSSDPTTIGQWLEKNRNPPAPYGEVAERLQKYGDRRALFDAFVQLNEVHIFSAACAAFEYTGTELRRRSPKVEDQSLDQVRGAIRTLRHAIEQSPLPKGWSLGPYELKGDGLPAVTLRVGWRDVLDSRNASALGGYPLSVIDVLNIADHLLDTIQDQLPGRTLGRTRHNAKVRAFVKWFSYALTNRFGDAAATPDGVAHVAYAVLQPRAGITADDVREILRSPRKRG